MTDLKARIASDLATVGTIAPNLPIWRDLEKREYTLSQMQTSHMIYILRIIVNEWARLVGVPQISRPSSMGYTPRQFNFETTPLSFFLIRARIFTLEIFRRLEAGESLPAPVARAWGQVQNKILECLNAGRAQVTDGNQWLTMHEEGR